MAIGHLSRRWIPDDIGLARRDDLDWASMPIAYRRVDTGHGRREVRTIQVTDAPADLGLPHAAQVFLIERYTTRRVRKRIKNSRRYKTVEVKTCPFTGPVELGRCARFDLGGPCRRVGLILGP